MKLKLFSRMQEFKRGSKTVKTKVFSTLMNLVVVGEEDKGAQKKYLNLKFRQDIDTSKLNRGYIEIEDTPENINYPYKYQILDLVDDKGKPILDSKGNQKKEYPCVWIRKDCFKYTEVLKKNNHQNLFVVDDEPEETPEESPELPFDDEE